MGRFLEEEEEVIKTRYSSEELLKGVELELEKGESISRSKDPGLVFNDS